MNKGFYIKELILSGPGKESAIVNFTDRLNLITGPSNTGKSWIPDCINYALGAGSLRMDEDGYTHIRMTLSNKGGDISIRREIGKNDMDITSSRQDIESGTYSADTQADNYFGPVVLKMMNINQHYDIVKNSLFVRQQLTLRTFMFLCLAEQTPIQKMESIILPDQNTLKTAAKSAMLLLMTGNDFSDEDPKEARATKEARRKAVIEYINTQLQSLAQKKDELEKRDELSPQEATKIKEKIQDLAGQISIAEDEISNYLGKSRELMHQIYELNSQISACDMLHNRYQKLQSQYESDIKRLTFVVEGEVHDGQLSKPQLCPFCKSEFVKIPHPHYIEAAQIELEKIAALQADLSAADNDVLKDRQELLRSVEDLKAKRAQIEVTISGKLRPKMEQLQVALEQYQAAIEVHHEAQVLDEYESDVLASLEKYNVPVESNITTYKPNNYFGTIVSDLNTLLDRILKECNFDGYQNVYFDLKTFDMVVNGSKKVSFGQGFRTFMNTVMLLTIREYLASNKCVYTPGFLIIDSPIMSLKEVDEAASDNMKTSLFKYLVNHQDEGQLIIVENTPPNIDYSGVNHIRYTRSDEGQYGFIPGKRNSDVRQPTSNQAE